MFWGKCLGFVFGWMLARLPGALFGLWLGHQYDKGLRLNLRTLQGTRHTLYQTQKVFFEQTFQVMGHLAKADGRVTEDTIRTARHIMARMQLTSEQRQRAVDAFQRGKAPDFDIDAALRQLQQHAHRPLLHMFVEIQFQATRANGTMGPNQKRLLQMICETLGFTPLFAWDDEPAFGGGYRRQQRSAGASPHTLSAAYQVLGVSERDDMKTIKQAYRRLMNQHHPDKLTAKGLPEEMIKLANDKTQQIKQAFETIKRHRASI